jgi:hypothetical protein
MPRLILFSGGVESTAMLSRSAPDDIALSIYDRGEPDPTFDVVATIGIAKALERRQVFAHLDVGVMRARDAFVYQTFALTAAASLWVSKDPSITAVWYGLKKGDPTPNVADQYWLCMEGWAAMHPNVLFTAPFLELDEREQWELIPAAVRPLVRNCLTVKDCGTCRKCLKLKALPGSFWCS